MCAGRPQELPKETNCGKAIALGLYEDIKDNAVLIDRSSQAVSDAVDLKETLVQMPFVSGLSTPSSQAIGILFIELFAPRRTVS